MIGASNEQRLTAFILRSIDYADSDRIVTFYSRELGKVAAFARAARKSRKRFGGTLEMFHRLRLSARDRRGDLLSLASAEIDHARSAIASDFDCIARASFLTELVMETTRDREPHPELFDLADLGFEILDSSEFRALDRVRRDAWLSGMEMQMLALAGWQPHLEACADCGDAGADAYRFVTGRGTLLCVDHASGMGVPLSGATARALLAMLRASPRELEAFVLGEAQVMETRRFLVPFLTEAIGKELKSARFLEAP